jgi:hypothetical protein
MKRPSQRALLWIAWCITIGEATLLVIFALVLSRYWLMAPVRIRNTAAALLLLATLIVIYRLFRFHRRRKRASLQPPPLPPNP